MIFKLLLLVLSVISNVQVLANGKRIIDITTVYEDSLVSTPIESCEDASPLFMLGVYSVFIERMVPDDAKEILTFKTSFYDIERKYYGRNAFVGEHEIIGHIQPMNYKITFSAVGDGKLFKIESATGSMVDRGKTQTELVDGACSGYQSIIQMLADSNQ